MRSDWFYGDDRAAAFEVKGFMLWCYSISSVPRFLLHPQLFVHALVCCIQRFHVCCLCISIQVRFFHSVLPCSAMCYSAHISLLACPLALCRVSIWDRRSRFFPLHKRNTPLTFRKPNILMRSSLLFQG